MNRLENHENHNSFKLGNINNINSDNFSLQTNGTSAYQSGSHQMGTEISLILGDSFNLENSAKNISNSFFANPNNHMKNKRNNFKINLNQNKNSEFNYKNSTIMNNRFILKEDRDQNNSFFEKKNLNQSNSTSCNLILEDDDDEIDNFLLHREGFKKHCEDQLVEEKDPNFLSDEEINSIIKEKMRILDIYNVVVLKKGQDTTEFR